MIIIRTFAPYLAVLASVAPLVTMGAPNGQDGQAGKNGGDANDPIARQQRVALVEELRLGSVDGGAEAFGRVSGVATIDGGTLWVADEHAASLLRFSAEGEFLGAVGRRGSGPGEFRSVMGVRSLLGQRVVTWDPGLARVTIFSSDGEVDFQFNVPQAVVLRDRRLLHTDTTSRVWILTHVATGPRREGQETWSVFDTTGLLLETVRGPVPDIRGPRFVRRRLAYTQMYAFTERTISAVSPCGYLVRGRNDRYRISWGAAPETTITVDRDWSPIEIRGDERHDYQLLEDLFASRRQVRPERVPSAKPPFWHLAVDADCRIWVARHSVGRLASDIQTGADAPRSLQANRDLLWREDRVFDVFDERGKFLWTVELPHAHSDVEVARGDHIWVVERGAYDETYVVRYRIAEH